MPSTPDTQNQKAPVLETNLLRLSQCIDRNPFKMAGLFFILAATLFAASIGFGFIHFDDARILLNHPEIFDPPGFIEGIRGVMTDHFPREEPLLLRDITWIVDATLFGFGNATGYHLGNVFLHGCVAGLLFLFLYRSTRRPLFAFGSTLLFICLAVHVEAVAWIMGRKDVLSTGFLLASLLAQCKRLESGSTPSKILWYLGSLACFTAALFSKINALSFPAVLLIHACLYPYLLGVKPADAALSWRKDVPKETVLILPFLIITLSVYFWYKGLLENVGLLDRGYTATTSEHLWNLFMVNPVVFLNYLTHFLFPSELALFYTWPTTMEVYPVLQMVIATLVVMTLAVMGLFLFLKRKDAAFYYFSFFFLMIPYLNLIYIGIWMADRYLYFASFCLSCLTMHIASQWWKRFSEQGRYAVLTVLAMICAINLFHQQIYLQSWRTPETFWTEQIERNPQAEPAYSNFSSYLYNRFYQTTDPETELEYIKWTASVVRQGLDTFWTDRDSPPPRQLYQLLFMRSLIEQVQGLPPEVPIETLLLVERLNPNYDAALLNLSRLHRDLASASEGPIKEQSAKQALDYYKKYYEKTYKSYDLPKRAENELTQLKQLFPFLSSEIESYSNEIGLTE